MFLREYCERPIDRRRQLIFRGQSSAAWGLKTTLDREHPSFASDEDREIFLNDLLDKFRRELLQFDL